MRFPPFLFGIGSTFMFVLVHRFPRKGQAPKERASVLWTDLALLAILLVSSVTIGWRAYVLVQLPIIFLASTVGVWLFYVQHQFEGVYWERHANWEFARSAILGASYYNLPKFLHWFTGNIGFHHIHHLNPRIPNYNLPRCHAENEVFWQARSLTVWQSLKSLRYRLWDEETRRLVGFRDIRRAQG
jgi:omega-6 fatty acid desaturase (delta-12 desaturase)